MNKHTGTHIQARTHTTCAGMFFFICRGWNIPEQEVCPNPAFWLVLASAPDVEDCLLSKPCFSPYSRSLVQIELSDRKECSEGLAPSMQVVEIHVEGQQSLSGQPAIRRGNFWAALD